jgi:UPF0716 family protein affecting phage T7 exclusion
MDALLSWLDDWKWWIAVLSAAMFFGSLAILPVVIVRLPADFLTRRKSSWKARVHPALRWILVVGKNVLGCLLVFAGLIMLVTPGQGLLAILVGLLLLDVPGKRRMMQKIVGQRRVLRTMNRLRAKYGRPPLKTA